MRYHGSGKANPVEFEILTVLCEWFERPRHYWFKASHPRFRNSNKESVRMVLLRLENLDVLRSKRVGVTKHFRIASGAYIGKSTI
jgi:hypothetical protein